MDRIRTELDRYIDGLEKSLDQKTRDELVDEESRRLKKKYRRVRVTPNNSKTDDLDENSNVNTILDDTPKKKYKKRKKSKKKKLDARREAYIKNLRVSKPDITDDEIDRSLLEYALLENMLLEMDMEYNERIAKFRFVLLKKYDVANPEILGRLRTELVKEELNKKIEFLKGSVGDSQLTDIAKERMESASKSVDVSHTMDFVNKVIGDHRTKKTEKDEKKMILHEENQENKKQENEENKKQENEVLLVDETDMLIEKYRLELVEKYKNMKVINKTIKNLINIELRSCAGKIRSDIELKYKLIDERKGKEREWKKLKKYKNSPEKLQRDLDKYINTRRRKLVEGFASGVDPDEQDKKAMITAEQLWRNINTEARTKAKKWNELSDKDKLEPFTKGVYKDFYEAYPLIVKYMVYQLQYHPKAFRRFLDKCRTNSANKDATKRKKDEMMEFWQENQAWYCRFLYEEYRKAKNLPVNIKYAQRIFADAYEKLRKEKKQFKTNFESTKDKLDEETVTNAQEKIHEIIEQLKSGKLSDEAKASSVDLLRQLVSLQNASSE